MLHVWDCGMFTQIFGALYLPTLIFQRCFFQPKCICCNSGGGGGGNACTSRTSGSMAWGARTLPVIWADRWRRTTLQSNTGNKHKILHTAGNLGRPVAPHDRIGGMKPQATGCSAEKTRCKTNAVQWTSNSDSTWAVRHVQHTGCQINAVKWTSHSYSTWAVRQVQHTGCQINALQ